MSASRTEPAYGGVAQVACNVALQPWACKRHCPCGSPFRRNTVPQAPEFFRSRAAPQSVRNRTSRHVACFPIRSGTEGQRLEMSLPKINSAINDCLEHCQRTEHTLANLKVFLDSLRSNPDWNEHEVKHVDATVRRVLAEIVSKPE